MDEGYFYDTNFHLNDAGVKVRTARLIEDIYRFEGRSEGFSYELPPVPERPMPENPNSWVENEWSELFEYDTFGSGLRITGVRDAAKDMEKLEIPYMADGKVVYMLSENAFAECKSLKEITIYDNLNVIENGAFDGAKSLERIHMMREEAEDLEAGAELFENAPSDLTLYFHTESSYRNFVSGYWWSAHAERMKLIDDAEGTAEKDK
jgi:hypothetical protein